MKSSCVTLTYKNEESNIYVVNLIDSPGHVDFSSEVSTAVRLCDGTIIVVDVVEGVCAQTKAVLRQAWIENIRPVLLLNKIDRLILEMKLTPLDAYYHITNVLEQVNAFMGELFNTDVLGRFAEEEEERKRVARERKASEGAVTSLVFSDWSVDDVDDSDLYFSPERGNVCFSSAFDGWGFRLSKFAQKYHEKFGMDSETLKNGLWGDYYITNRGGKKQVVSGAKDKAKPPLFVSLILENIYKIYEAVMTTKDNVEVEKIVKSLGIKYPMSISKSSDPRVKLTFIMSNWLPLASSVLEMVIRHLPSPCEMTEDRARKLMCTATQRFDSLPSRTLKLKEAFVKCSSDEDAPLIVYISKMFGVEKSVLSRKNAGGGPGRPSSSVAGAVSLQEIEERRRQIQNREKQSGKIPLAWLLCRQLTFI
ncbi:UNVERIFIED_CONTAM: hypothetical protein GTU68_012963 [Idotea baltica]|nr:hypothetical protein [Idotea baltica]